MYKWETDEDARAMAAAMWQSFRHAQQTLQDPQADIADVANACAMVVARYDEFVQHIENEGDPDGC